MKNKLIDQSEIITLSQSKNRLFSALQRIEKALEASVVKLENEKKLREEVSRELSENIKLLEKIIKSEEE